MSSSLSDRLSHLIRQDNSVIFLVQASVPMRKGHHSMSRYRFIDRSLSTAINYECKFSAKISLLTHQVPLSIVPFWLLGRCYSEEPALNVRRACVNVTRRSVLEFAFGRLGVTTAHAS